MNWQVRTNNWGRAADKEPNWIIPKKQINRIYYIHSGTGYYEVNGTCQQFEHNKLYVLPDNVRIQVSQDHSDPMDHTFFDFDAIPGFRVQNIICIDVARHPMIKSMLQVFQQLIHTCGNTNVPLLSSEILAVINSLLSNLLWMIDKVECLSSIADPRILDTLRYILDNLNAALSVEELAARVFLEKNYFIRLFAQNTGRTPHVYIRNCRMHYAVTLLQEGRPAKIVAQQCGYESYCAFSRAFKAYYGYPPKAYLDTMPPAWTNR